jgi:hypothetical protein
MTRLLSLFLSACLCILASVRISAGEAPEKSAQTAAEQWLALIDAGQYAASWETAATIFKKAVKTAEWTNSLDVARKPLGNLISRKLESARFTKTMPGAPDGEYVVIQFQTSFSNKKSATETVTPMRDTDGKWKVSGYFIR